MAYLVDRQVSVQGDGHATGHLARVLTRSESRDGRVVQSAGREKIHSHREFVPPSCGVTSGISPARSLEAWLRTCTPEVADIANGGVMTAVCALAILTLLGPSETVPGAHLQTDARVLAAFQQHIAEYIEIHRMAAAGLGDPVLCADPEELSRQSAILAAAIREARPTANEGDVFTVAIAPTLRARIAAAVHAARIAPAAAGDDEERVLEVHATIPAGRWNYSWMPILHALPDLPPELEYQLVGRHLVLVDVRANLVVDVLRYALPGARRPRDIGPADPCDVHPELPSCWM
jgi:hypothetical protein